MSTAVVFDLISALVDKFDALLPASVLVLDGQGATADLGNFVMVGLGNPNADNETSANGNLEWAGLGHKSSKEHGSIACCAVAVSGDVGNAAQRAVRQAVRDIVSVLEVSLRDDPNLAGTVPGLNWVRYAGDFDFDQISATDGVGAVFHFEVRYEASLTV